MENKRIKIIKGKKCCYKCNSEISTSEKFDCSYCSKCNIWLEPKCGDLFCLFCKSRPTRPTNKSLEKKNQAKQVNKKTKTKAIQWKI